MPKRDNEEEKHSKIPTFLKVLGAGLGVAAGMYAAYNVGRAVEKEHQNTSPSRSFNQMSNLQNEHEDCSVCLRSMKPLIQLPCGHVFHDDCGQTWLSKNPTCPICRSKVEHKNN